jgi:hypothetical protein
VPDPNTYCGLFCLRNTQQSDRVIEKVVEFLFARRAKGRLCEISRLGFHEANGKTRSIHERMSYADQQFRNDESQRTVSLLRRRWLRKINVVLLFKGSAFEKGTGT